MNHSLLINKKTPPLRALLLWPAHLSQLQFWIFLMSQQSVKEPTKVQMILGKRWSLKNLTFFSNSTLKNENYYKFFSWDNIWLLFLRLQVVLCFFTHKDTTIWPPLFFLLVLLPMHHMVVLGVLCIEIHICIH